MHSINGVRNVAFFSLSFSMLAAITYMINSFNILQLVEMLTEGANGWKSNLIPQARPLRAFAADADTLMLESLCSI